MNNPCSETTCQNGGTCYADSLMNTQCLCQEGFDGQYCEIDTKTTTSTSTTSTTEPTSK